MSDSDKQRNTRGAVAGNLLEEIDRYVEQLCVRPDAALDHALRAAVAAGLPPIHVSGSEGKLLYLLAKLVGARRILEIGTLGGYSTIWLARALPADGRLLTLELDVKHATVARRNLAHAKLAGQVEVRVGPALESLAKLVKDGVAPFDVVFIDADKETYPAYLDWSLKLTHSGSLILADNVLRRVFTDTHIPGGNAVQEFNQKLAAHPALECILLPILRGNVDGLAIARVR